MKEKDTSKISTSNNKIIIFCAPSGSGKTTIVKHLIASNNRLAFSVSACTRKQRANEVNGKDYYFISMQEFKDKIANNEFIEYEEVYDGNYYGTLKSEISRLWEQNKVIIFDVDVIGGLNLKKYFGDAALAVFVKPPNIKVLEERLRFRSTETEENLQIRIKKAITELSYEHMFERVLLNENLDKTFIEAEQLIHDFINK
ncbi:MAG: guanylate kinase [Bacteroidia bacterium]|nr:guanylate kinase [Bacteroidia bacterium]